MVKPALEVVEEQLAAYNDRDLARFARTYADDVEIYRPPAPEPVIRGAAALAEFYRDQRFCHVGLRAEILGRLVTGNLVSDHERVHGLPGGPVEVFATYEVVGGRIRRVWLFAPSAV
ncbi:MAG: nuclear transport factor 2 family protein [Steroidobacteraceae bacterium]